MTTYTLLFTTSESKVIKSAIIKAYSKEMAIQKLYKKNRSTSTTLIKVY